MHHSSERPSPSVPAVLAPAPLIAAKLLPPGLPAVLVERPDERQGIDAGAQVVAVVAPAGYGKTTLVREWLEHRRPRPAAWYSLDALDTNPLCFWRHVVAALQDAVDIGAEPSSVLDERGADTVFLHSLVHALVTQVDDVVLVLDDLHHLRDRATLDQLALLVERAAPPLRLVFTARSVPALPLSRWRLQGQVTELRDADLRFDERQTARMLDGLGCAALDDGQLADLVKRSEGWVAGLQLAALARPDAALQALHDLPVDGLLVADYLVVEVLESLPDDERRVALELSVVDEFDIPLAAALTGRTDVATHIRSLLEGNVFLGRVGDDRSTFRFHPLFRDLLRRELHDRDVEAWTRLHREAATLAAERGQTPAAFEHLMAVADLDAALDLIVRPGLALSDQGHGRHFRRWLEQLPTDLDVRDPSLMLDLAFANFTAGHLDQAERWLDAAAPWCDPNDQRIALRRMAVAVARGDIEAAVSAIETGRKGMGLGDRTAFEARFDTTAARLYVMQGAPDLATQALDRAAAGSGDALAVNVTVPAIRARVAAMSGAVDEAVGLAVRALEQADVFGVRDNPAYLEATIALAVARLGQADVGRASAAVDAVLEVVDVVDYPYSRAHSVALLVELHALQHGWAATAGRLDSMLALAGLADRTSLPWLTQPLWVRALVAAGRLSEARAIVDEMSPGVAQRLAMATVLHAARRYDDAIHQVAANDTWTARQRIEALVLLAECSTGVLAEEYLSAALQLARPLGLVSSFLGRGDDLVRLLRRLPAESTEFASGTGGFRSDDTGAAPAIIDPLTPRELELLALLPTHLSNSAMGERLFVSINTVKTNLKAIYRKFGTASRAETVARARSVGLLPADDASG
jgi:LuxR family maltose regulon positive regulatory protein